MTFFCLRIETLKVWGKDWLMNLWASREIDFFEGGEDNLVFFYQEFI